MKDITKKLLIFSGMNLGYIGYITIEIHYYLTTAWTISWIPSIIGTASWLAGTYYFFKSMKLKEKGEQ